MSFLAEVDVTNKKRVFTRSSSPDVFCKKTVRKYLAKLTAKNLCRSVYLACRCETLFKKRVLHRCFSIKLSQHLFHRTHVNSLNVALKFYTSMAKVFKTIHHEVFGANSYVCGSYRGKTDRRGPFCSIILNSVKARDFHCYYLIQNLPTVIL